MRWNFIQILVDVYYVLNLGCVGAMGREVREALGFGELMRYERTEEDEEEVEEENFLGLGLKLDDN